MESLMEVLPIILYSLGIVLIIVLKELNKKTS